MDVQRILHRVDDFQQRRRGLAFPFAVVKKFGDDQAGYLAALLAYYGFFSLFPLLLVFVSVVGLLASGNPDLQRSILDSALKNFPVIGTDIAKNLGKTAGSGVALTIGIVGAVWAGLAVTQAAQNAMNTIWDVPRKDRPNFLISRARGLIMLVVLGTITLASTFTSAFGASEGRFVLTRLAGFAAGFVLNLLLFLLAYRVLTVMDLSWKDVLPGAVVAAVLWTVLQSVGGFYVTHQLQGASNTYGTFAIVIGLLVWLYLGAQLTLYCAEINVVRVQKLWPRSLVQPPLAEGDKEVMEGLAKQQQLRPEQEIDVTFEDDARTERGR
ncbi:MAG TPA: YihY/virulence factor BrkB family protein [Actinomycetota bacterium]|nr:YihY/virulence factor BrkB family protein [Actinomycetota bacterium]